MKIYFEQANLFVLSIIITMLLITFYYCLVSPISEHLKLKSMASIPFQAYEYVFQRKP